MLPSSDWLSSVINDAIVRGLCMRIGCSTCGAGEFRKVVSEAIHKVTGTSPPVSPATFSVTLAQGLSLLTPGEGIATKFSEPTRFLLYELWRLESLNEVEPILVGSWAWKVLSQMRVQHTALQQQAAYLAGFEERRELKRQAKQKKHAEMLIKQAEKARRWYLEHGSEPPGSTYPNQE